MPEPILDAIATRLEARGQHPAMRRMLHEYLEAMAIDQAQAVLVLGSGTGMVPRAPTVPSILDSPAPSCLPFALPAVLCAARQRADRSPALSPLSLPAKLRRHPD